MKSAAKGRLEKALGRPSGPSTGAERLGDCSCSARARRTSSAERRAAGAAGTPQRDVGLWQNRLWED